MAILALIVPFAFLVDGILNHLLRAVSVWGAGTVAREQGEMLRHLLVNRKTQAAMAFGRGIEFIGKGRRPAIVPSIQAICAQQAT